MKELLITWLGHACFQLRCGDTTVVIDPYREVPGYPALHTEADAVFASHTQHDDHGYFDAVALSGKDSTEPFTVHTIQVFHDDQGGALRGENRITIFEAEGFRIAHLGDLGHMLSREQLVRLSDLDVLRIPVGSVFTIDGVQAAKLAEQIGAKLVLPMHFRKDGLGYEVIDGPETFWNALPDCFVRIKAENACLKLQKESASVVVDGTERTLDLNEDTKYAVLLNFQ